MLREGTNTEIEFSEFFQLISHHHQQRLPAAEFKAWQRRTVLIFDNARIHLTARAKSTVNQLALTALTLPAYSPELNPIEHVFSLAKRAIVKSANG